MQTRKNTALLGCLLLVVLGLYVGGYLAVRQARAEVWSRDGRS
jgi:hypothetical protein